MKVGDETWQKRDVDVTNENHLKGELTDKQVADKDEVKEKTLCIALLLSKEG